MPRVNLVPAEERRRQLERQAYLFPIITVVVVGGILGGSYLYYSTRIGNTQEQLDDYRSRNAGQAREVAELRTYDELKNQKQTRLNNVTSAYNGRFRWSRMLDDLSFVVPEELSLTRITGKVPGAQTGARDSGAGRGTTRDLEFEGFTRSMPDVAIFMVRLGLIPSLFDVSLQLAEVEEIGGERPIHFIINASIRMGDTQRPAPAPNTGENGPSRVTPTTTTPTTSTTPATTETGAGTQPSEEEL